MYVLSREEMRELDRYTIEQFGLSSPILMENAGRGCAEIIRSDYLQHGDKIGVFCGQGNNGGDGFVIARWLKSWGWSPKVFFVGDNARMSPETSTNRTLCTEMDIPIREIHNDEGLSILAETRFDLIVDALYGIGLKGPLRGWCNNLIRTINAIHAKIVSVDIASGVDSDTGLAAEAIRADCTITMSSPKYGHFLGDGRTCTGRLVVVDVGIPSQIYDRFPPRGRLQDTPDFPQRNPFNHKGEYGRIGIIGGSHGYSGAPVMAARAALRAGAGLVTVIHPPGMGDIFETQLLEAMTRKMPENSLGSLDRDEFSLLIRGMDVLLAGPGLRMGSRAVSIIRHLIDRWNKPMVLDADALNIMSEHREMLDHLAERPIVLTPHLGEFARLTGKKSSEVKNDIVGHLREFVDRYQTSVLLKTATTLFADPGGMVINIKGNDGLATGGSGDVLAGILVSFLAQRMPVHLAAPAASWLMGDTAEYLAEIRHTPSIIPSDIIENLFVNR